MANFAQGIYTPKHPEKYLGNHKPRFRSGWEMSFMMFLDNNDNILKWASESISIPYKHPMTGKTTMYIPDFFVLYQNKFGQQIAEVVEIKPKKQSLIESKKASMKDRMIVAINQAKWASATAYCKRMGMTFRVLTEENLFHQGSRK
jgi:hypothetical protein